VDEIQSLQAELLCYAGPSSCGALHELGDFLCFDEGTEDRILVSVDSVTTSSCCKRLQRCVSRRSMGSSDGLSKKGAYFESNDAVKDVAKRIDNVALQNRPIPVSNLLYWVR
jgi:hypothetical protein